nr:hypothetical protein Ade03nite_85020 [Actinoplanes derwentensis]
MAHEDLKQAAGPPVKFAILMSGRHARWVILAAPHALLDGHAFEILEYELRTLIETPGKMAEPSAQPADWTASEGGAAGRRQSERSIGHIVRVLQRFRTPLFPMPAGRERGAINVVRGVGAGFGVHIRHVAENSGVSTAAVSIAALSLSFSRNSGSTAFALGVTSSNRFMPRSESYVGMMAQNGVLGVDASSGNLSEVSAEVASSLMSCYRYSRYDQDDLGAELRQQSLDFDYIAFGAVGHFVNFIPDGPGRHPDFADDTLAVSLSEESLAESRIPRFGVVMNAGETDVRIRIFADEGAISGQTAKAIVRDFFDALTSHTG